MTQIANINENQYLEKIDLLSDKANYGFKYLRVGSILLKREDIVLVNKICDFEKITVDEKGNIDFSSAYITGSRYNSLSDLKEGKIKWGDRESDIHLREGLGQVFGNIEEFERYIKKTENNELDEFLDENEIKTESTEIARVASKELLQAQLTAIQEVKRKGELLASAQRYRMRVVQEQMDKMRRVLEEKCSELAKQVTKIQKLIWTIELYLGIKETIHQLKSGETSNDTINYFQKVLYMDVEYGKPGDESIDFTNIEQFDNWLIKDDNFKLFTTPRCVRVFRVRKNDKRGYSDNPWLNGIINLDNHKTYFLIRNGDNLYRIHSDLIVNKLFPDQDEFIKLQKEKSSWYNEEQQEERLQEKIDHYKRNIIMLQGLTVRTEVFNPLPEDFNLFDPKIHESGLIKFIYTKNELIESDGRKQFWDWVEDINSRIDVGSRVMWMKCCGGVDYDRFSEKFYSWRWNYKDSYSAPQPPNRGEIFHIKEYGGISKNIYTSDYHLSGSIIFNSNRNYDRFRWDDEDTHEQKHKKTLFRFNHGDSWLNYDACTLNDVNYYLNNRESREDYMNVFPILFELQKRLIEDKKYQDFFKEMILGYIKSQGKNIEEWRVDQVIDWWKNKNKWKRSLQSDDLDHEAKAFRMIIKKLIR